MCLRKEYNETEEIVSLMKDCGYTNNTVWSYKALNYGEYVMVYISPNDLTVIPGDCAPTALATANSSVQLCDSVVIMILNLVTGVYLVKIRILLL